jgi:hypothetical protein
VADKEGFDLWEFLDAVRLATPADVEFSEEALPVHPDLRQTDSKVAVRPSKILGVTHPDPDIVMYVRAHDPKGTYWYVLNSSVVGPSGETSSSLVDSEELAKEKVLHDLKALCAGSSSQPDPAPSIRAMAQSIKAWIFRLLGYKVLKVGDRVHVGAGYDMEPEWLQGGTGYTGTVEEFLTVINTGRKDETAIIRLDAPLSLQGVTASMLQLSLRHEGARWADTGSCHAVLCAQRPPQDRDDWFRDKAHFAWVESHATYKKIT